MSIVPSPGQMGPGTGSVGAVLMKHPTLFKGLGMGPALSGLGIGIYLGDLSRARYLGFGNDVQAYRENVSDKFWAQTLIPVTSLIVRAHHELIGIASISPGGGGPGDSPISTVTPPSIEETGEILSNSSIVGEVPSSPRSSSSSKTGKRRKSCPPGYRWNGRRCVKKG
jgi:hypothetical protein